MSNLRVPAFSERPPRRDTHAKPARQQRRVLQLPHACGHTAPVVTEAYSEKGLEKLRRAALSNGCGQCFWNPEGPSTDGSFPQDRPGFTTWDDVERRRTDRPGRIHAFRRMPRPGAE